jgi:hypothetical protein
LSCERQTAVPRLSIRGTPLTPAMNFNCFALSRTTPTSPTSRRGRGGCYRSSARACAAEVRGSNPSAPPRTENVPRLHQGTSEDQSPRLSTNPSVCARSAALPAPTTTVRPREAWAGGRGNILAGSAVAIAVSNISRRRRRASWSFIEATVPVGEPARQGVRPGASTYSSPKNDQIALT